MIIINSYQHDLSENQIRKTIENCPAIDPDKIEELTIWSISKKFAGHGHYQITADIELKKPKRRMTLSKITTDMFLIDTWNDQDYEARATALDQIITANLEMITSQNIEE